MKQIVQNYSRGSLSIEEVPEPALRSKGVLVQTYHSLISPGTEKMKISNSKKSYVGMARARPEKMKQVFETLNQQGPISTYRKVMNRLDSFTPLGYSLAGKVIDIGDCVVDIKVGDMVACGGGEIATHSEINWIPVNLCCKLPRSTKWHNGFLPTDEAAFTTVGAIAMHAVRQAEVHVGENIAVIGLGLLGLLSCLILKAAGCNVIGFDLDTAKAEMADKIGIDKAGTIGRVDVEQLVSSFTDGIGVDAVLITTGTKSNDPIITAGAIARDRGTIVDIGINKMDIPWQLYYEKELVLKQSRSYGPGRYDPKYEIEGQDYPVGYVRWTEKRNMASFLRLMATGKVDVRPLITHRYSFDKAKDAYNLLEGTSDEFYVGIILEYDQNETSLRASRIRLLDMSNAKTASEINLAMIGAGNFARTMLLPYLQKMEINLHTIATATGISCKDTARKFGFTQCSTDYNSLLKNDEINTVLIATRHNLHANIVLESLREGKHVYTEKPLCLNENELNTIANFYETNIKQKHCVLMVGFNRRYAPMITKMKAFFRDRKHPMVIYYRVNAGFKDKDDWYQNKYIGGGRIIGEVCHFIDTLQYLTDALPVSVFAQTIQSDYQMITQEDNVTISIQFYDGSIGTIAYVANGDPQFPKEYIEVFCENRVAVIDNFSTLTIMANGKKKARKAFLQDKGHKNEMRAFINSVRGGTVPIPFESIYATTLATFRIHDSIKNRKSVDIN